MDTLKDVRLERGMSQKDIAAFLGITQGTWSFWENGKTDISKQMVQALKGKLGMTYAQIKEVHRNTLQNKKK